MSGVSSHETDLLVEEGTGAEDALLHYCKPVEFYNVLKHRAANNPYFLQRSMQYKREAEPVNRLRAGNVIFCYQEGNKKEVTENFTCSICLTKCGNFKGLRLHLTSSHDFFNFEFKESKQTRVVNVSVKPNTWSNKVIGGGDDPVETFFWSRKQKRISQQSNHVVTFAVHPDDGPLPDTSPDPRRSTRGRIPTPDYPSLWADPA